LGDQVHLPLSLKTDDKYRLLLAEGVF